ncbi:hypothetical protein HAX54_024871 [Datura stramonium]|uniref:Leucine-rich repeat-containing N-terminal plant-type domain-containing protein n=1 Tax=Datura stramonium TaxID=4076 RepID=A0ABS8V0P1_DATST|nr:hypothetical protein [Datura stramonium]
MKLIKFLMFFVLYIGSAMGQLPSQDILVLLEFKKSVKHDPTGFLLESWNEESIDFNGCPSSWNGIMCNGNLFTSSLPPEVGKLESLKNLSLAGNNFSGPIPDTISGLMSVQSLDLSHNSFSGPLPSSLMKLTGLVYLNLSVNGFTKKISKGFELMENLQVLDLHGNMLDGNLDPELMLLTTATHVDLSGNLLVNSASQQQKFLPGISETVKYLNLSHNQLKGSLVSGNEAQIFGNLKILDLSYNQLSGDMPSFNFVCDLQVLKLGNTYFPDLSLMIF